MIHSINCTHSTPYVKEGADLNFMRSFEGIATHLKSMIFLIYIQGWSASFKCFTLILQNVIATRKRSKKRILVIKTGIFTDGIQRLFPNPLRLVWNWLGDNENLLNFNNRLQSSDPTELMWSIWFRLVTHLGRLAGQLEQMTKYSRYEILHARWSRSLTNQCER